MGQTVVFSVSLVADDVSIEQREPRPPRRAFREAALTAFRDRHWRLAALACLVAPALAAGVTFAITGGAWVSTATLVTAALVTPASAAWAATRKATGPWPDRIATWSVTGLAGAAIALANVPAVAVIASAEAWGESGLVPTLAVLVLIGAMGAWLGLGAGNRERPWARRTSAVLVAALAFAPLAIGAAMVPQTAVTEQIVSRNFVAAYAGGRPAYICGEETVEVTRLHTEDVAWIALASPLFWVVDAPQFSPADLAAAPAGTVAQAQAWTRSTRVGPDDFVGYCYQATSLAPPRAVKEARYAQAGPLGAELATASALLAAAMALYAVSRRRSA